MPMKLEGFDGLESDGSEAEWDGHEYRRSWLMNYTHNPVEDRYVEFVNTWPSTAQIALCWVMVVACVFLFVVETQSSLLVRVVILGSGILAAPPCVYASFLCWEQRKAQSPSDPRVRRARVFARRSSFFVLTLGTLVGIVVVASDTSNGCVGQEIYKDERRAFGASQCERSVNSIEVSFLTAAVLMQLPVRVLVSVGTVGIVANAAVWGAIRPKHTSIAFMHPLLYALCFALHVYIRVLIESGERRRFEDSEDLERATSKLKSRRERLTEHCERVLPVGVSQQVSGTLFMRIDSARNATIVSVAFHNFAVMCTSHQMDEVAGLVEKVRVYLTAFCRAGGLRLVPAPPGEFLAVGNMRGGDADFAAYQACALALKVTKLSKSQAGDPSSDGSKPSLVCAVHVGPAVGGFVGRSWIRYDVFGDGPRKCRAARSACNPSDSLLTSETLAVVAPYVDVEASDEGADASPLQLARLISVDEHNRNSFTHASDLSMSDPMYCEDASLSEDSLQLSGLEAALNYRVKDGGLRESTNDNELQGWLFKIFVSDEKEHVFRRNQTSQRRSPAANTWLCYAVFLTTVFVLLVADLAEPPMVAAGIPLYIICVVGSVASGLAVSKLSNQTLATLVPAWSVLATVIPALSVLSISMTRPSTIANDVRSFISTAAVVRSMVVFESSSHAYAKPLMLILVHLHLLLPGAIFRINDLAAMVLVIWSILMDVEVDRSERANFLVKEKTEAIFEQLSEEERVRVGLLRATLPPAVFERTVSGTLEDASAKNAAVHVSDTAVVLVTKKSSAIAATTSRRTVSIHSRWLTGLERTMGNYNLSIVSAFGDQLLAIAPLSLQTTSGSEEQGNTPEAHVHNALFAGVQIRREFPDCSVMVEADETIQISRCGHFPSFSVYGVAVTRLLAITSSVDESAINGVLATERVLRWTKERTKDSLTFTTGQPWRVRGVGTIRLHEATEKHQM